MKLNSGDWVEVKSPAEITATLDSEGAVDGLPFMPEMIQYCGRRFRVLRWAEKTCFEAKPYDYVLRELRGDDVLFLEGLRCKGDFHDGCQRLCLFFWKTAWLRKADLNQPPSSFDATEAEKLRARLKTKTPAGRYICQSTEMAKASQPGPIKKSRVLLKCFRDVRSGAINVFDMLSLILMPVCRKVRDAVFGRPYLTGNLTKTPVGSLNLQPGELVEVRSLEEMRQTLDRNGRNRGLICDIELGVSCGKRYRVLSRLERFISDHTGEMRTMQGTVILDGVHCLCSRVVGGCSRLDYGYYREVWLKRVDPVQQDLIQIVSEQTKHAKLQETA